jgi:hypothetical protein
MLEHLPEMEYAGVSLPEVVPRIGLISLYKFFILKDLMNLVLKKYHNNE